MMSFAKRKKLVSTSDSSVSMSVHLRATRDMQPTAMTYYEEEQSRLPQSRPRVVMYRDPACRGLGHPNPVRHHLLHALADGYAKGGAAEEEPYPNVDAHPRRSHCYLHHTIGERVPTALCGPHRLFRPFGYYCRNGCRC